MILEVRNLAKHYSAAHQVSPERPNPAGVATRAVDDVSFEVAKGELFTLLGPSGCGKTTTLRSIAGLEDPDDGRIRLRDTLLFDSESGVNVPCNQRGLAMVFQSYAIWPHMSVFENVAFPISSAPRRQRPGRSAVRERVERALETVGLGDYAGRPGTALSGGQQQRLALARALATEPSVILLDEPLSNLDPKLRASMRLELKRLQRETNVTAIYVTHDQAEALSLSNHVAVMDAGHIIQMGKPREIYNFPRNKFVADFLGNANFVEGTLAALDGRTAVVTADGGVTIRSEHAPEQMAPGDRVCVCIRPENIRLSPVPDRQLCENELEAEMLTSAFLGDSLDVVVSAAGRELRVRCAPEVQLRRGERVVVSVSPAHVLLLPPA